MKGKHLGTVCIYPKGLNRIFRYYWDLSGGCLLIVHLGKKMLDWEDLNDERATG